MRGNVIIVRFLPFPFQFSPKATMLVLAGIVVLHITTIILLLVATIDNVSESIQKGCATKILQPFKQQETNITDVPVMFWATWTDIFRRPTCPWWPRKALNACHNAAFWLILLCVSGMVDLRNSVDRPVGQVGAAELSVALHKPEKLPRG